MLFDIHNIYIYIYIHVQASKYTIVNVLWNLGQSNLIEISFHHFFIFNRRLRKVEFSLRNDDKNKSRMAIGVQFYRYNQRRRNRCHMSFVSHRKQTQTDIDRCDLLLRDIWYERINKTPVMKWRKVENTGRRCHVEVCTYEHVCKF